MHCGTFVHHYDIICQKLFQILVYRSRGNTHNSLASEMEICFSSVDIHASKTQPHFYQIHAKFKIIDSRSISTKESIQNSQF